MMSGSKHPVHSRQEQNSVPQSRTGSRPKTSLGLASTSTDQNLKDGLMPQRTRFHDKVLEVPKLSSRPKPLACARANSLPQPCLKSAVMPSVMIYILGSSSCLQVDRCDFVYLVRVLLPKTTSSKDFHDLIIKILKDKLPRYSGGFECRFSQQDMDHSSVRIAKLATEQKVSPSDMPPGMLLPLLGRVFVVLSEPSDLPQQSKHVSPLTAGLERHLRNSIPLHFPKTSSVAEESWSCKDAFDPEEECPRILSPIWDSPNRKRKRPVTPGLDDGTSDAGSTTRTLKEMKEIEDVINSLMEITKEFNSHVLLPIPIGPRHGDGFQSKAQARSNLVSP